MKASALEAFRFLLRYVALTDPFVPELAVLFFATKDESEYLLFRNEFLPTELGCGSTAVEGHLQVLVNGRFGAVNSFTPPYPGTR